ncbi:hypothetical protein [Actinosynnema sp. NPDC023587]|uniref:hypothetical protein n=1 Tax=Actinosynnema sp. NPDC023587 TaxID=3154695 RepID=UPI0033E2D9E4
MSVPAATSLLGGLASPRTPLRRFLDRELSAGSRPLRATYCAQLSSPRGWQPGPGVGFEAGTVGTAVDQRLRLAFTAADPVDAATRLGVADCRIAAESPILGIRRGPLSEALATVGAQLVDRITATVAEMEPDNRRHSILGPQDDEEQLARLLIAAAWYALRFRVPIAFPQTPLFRAAAATPRGFDLEALLRVPHPDLVADVLAQLDLAEHGDLTRLRYETTPASCHAGPTFDGSAHIDADADLIVDGMLIDFKSTRDIHAFPLDTIHQLLCYTLLDYSDRFTIDALGVYLTRAGRLIHWPLERYLHLLGTCRRDLSDLRAQFATLCGNTTCPADSVPLTSQRRSVDRLLRALAPVIPDGHCPVCAQPIVNRGTGSSQRRRYCSLRCRRRAAVLQRQGHLPYRRSRPRQSRRLSSSGSARRTRRRSSTVTAVLRRWSSKTGFWCA